MSPKDSDPFLYVHNKNRRHQVRFSLSMSTSYGNVRLRLRPSTCPYVPVAGPMCSLGEFRGKVGTSNTVDKLYSLRMEEPHGWD